MLRSLALAGSIALIGAGLLTRHDPAMTSVASHPQAIVHPAVAHLRSVHGSQQQSSNWSGYVASQGGYQSVTGTWRVPTVTVTPDDRYSSTWVGIGGDPTPDLIQAGTEQDSVGGRAVYTAWTEFLPEPESPIASMTVHPGDLMQVTITAKLKDKWTITVRDATTRQSFSKGVAYPSLHATAEWIHEAPTVGGTIANLAVTSNADFDLCAANGRVIRNAGSVDTIVMLDANNARIATPGGLDSDGDGFAVADGPNAPAPPAS